MGYPGPQLVLDESLGSTTIVCVSLALKSSIPDPLIMDIELSAVKLRCLLGLSLEFGVLSSNDSVSSI